MGDGSSVYILTGMHRSGTSLMSRFLVRSGIDMGDKLLESHVSNPYGHFEDMGMLEFHSDILRRQNWGDDQWVKAVPRINAKDKAKGARLIEERQKKKAWGWKDPRTCLFLELWAELIPDAKVLFVFRHPILTLDSLCRRHHTSCNSWWYSWQHHKFLRSWMVYNWEVIKFYEEHRDRCVLFALEHAVGNPRGFTRLLQERLGWRFRQEDFVSCYDQGILQSRPVRSWRQGVHLRVKAEKVYENLLGLAMVEYENVGIVMS